MSDTNFGKAREQFEYFLSLLVEPWLQEHKSQWEELDINKSLNYALDKKQD
ncbi:hypothetical protein [Grimontia hollisae]|uniref:hypothetical protein n=1 Tax=Grimontia hollisae TaxID=673 RepID=UPI000AA8CA5A|nr:hypothetical protein [Grimontia hollisae]MDF2185919.1 hypothetical protein [Grimontia hollisae]